MTSLTTPLHETNITMTNPTQPPTPSQEAREAYRARMKAVVDELNNSSQKCLDAVNELTIMRLEDEAESLRSKLTALQSWSERARRCVCNSDFALLDFGMGMSSSVRVENAALLSSFPAEDAKEGERK